MKALVTGVDGYIGALLAPMLMERGHDVVGVDTGFYRDGWLRNIRSPWLPPCLNKDIRQITREDLAGFEAVIHMAELSNDPLGHLRPEVTYDINHIGSVELAKKCKEAGVTRFVYTSSCSVYGAGTGDFKTEESETNPQTPYAECKVRVERDLSRLADDDFSPTFLRNATAYGPSPRMRFDLVLNNLAGLAWTTKQIRMTSDGTPWRPLVHVLDICEAIDRTVQAPKRAVHNQIFNVGNTRENFRVKEIAEIVADVFPGCETSFGQDHTDTRSYRVSFEKIRSQLPGFRCERTARQGASELRELFEVIHLPREVFEFRAFTRLRQIEYLIRTGQLDERFFWR
jgi:nucleoside-diphosphate-sugar epimerase